MITYDQFSQVEIIAGTVIKSEQFPKAHNPSLEELCNGAIAP